MKKLVSLALVFALLLSCVPFQTAAAKKSDTSNDSLEMTDNSNQKKTNRKIDPKKIKADYVDGDVMVGLKEPCDASKMAKLFPELNIANVTDVYGSVIKAAKMSKKDVGASVASMVGTVYRVELASKKKQSVIDAIQVLNQSPHVDYAEPNYTSEHCFIPNGGYYATNQWNMDKIKMPVAWEKYRGSSALKVAIMDSGIYGAHQDLRNNVNTVGYNAATSTSTDLTDYKGTGTHTAGIIGAKGDDNYGIAGMNWFIDMVSIKMMAGSASYTSNAFTQLNAIIYATIQEIPISNLSYTLENVTYLVDAIRNYTGLLIVAAGNNGADISNTSIYREVAPFDNVIIVGASDRNDRPLADSNYSATAVHLFAPGMDIVGPLSPETHNNYQTRSGTSAAAPHVTGAAALLKAHCPHLSNKQIKQALIYGADYNYYLNGKCVANGRLNVSRSFELAEQMATYADVNGDGHKDLITSGDLSEFKQGQGRLFIYKWTASGYTRNNQVTCQTGLSLNLDKALKFADINGDGRDDLIAIDRMYGRISVSRSDGNGYFGWHSTSSAGLVDAQDTYYIADANGDWLSDVVCVKGSNAGTRKGYVSVIPALSNGNGYAGSGAVWTSSSRLVQDGDALHFADIDGNIADEMILQNRTDGRVYVSYFKYTLPNYGYEVWSNVSGVTVDDEDILHFVRVTPEITQIADNYLDMVVERKTLYRDGHIDVSKGTSNGFQTWTTNYTTKKMERDSVVQFGDVNNDDLDDIIIAENTLIPNGSAVYTYLSSGVDYQYSASLKSPISLQNGRRQFVLEDVNNDGKLDLCSFGGFNSTTTRNSLNFALGNGNGTYTENPSRKFSPLFNWQ